MLRTLILAGGKGTRISELSARVPKPMIEANKKPLFLHIVDQYSKYGVNEFTILGGYKFKIFEKYLMYNFSSIEKNKFKYKDSKIELLNTGSETMTGGRIKRALSKYKDEEFFLTYGDGVADVNIRKLYSFHQKESVLATVTAVNPPPRFGILNIKKNRVVNFQEKPDINEWINGGYFVINRKIIKLLKDDMTIFEKKPLEKLSKEKNLAVYKHNGFWQCVDSLKDLEVLQNRLKIIQ